MRFFAVTVVLSCLVSSAWAQAQPAPGTPATPPATPAVKKQSPNKAAAKPSAPANNGPCDLGVIAAAGTPIGLKKIGITVFGNEYSEVPFDAWGIDDLIVARVRAAAGARIAVRRMPRTRSSLTAILRNG